MVMNRNSRLVCFVLAGAILIGNTLEIFRFYILPTKDYNSVVPTFDLVLGNIYSALSLFPHGLPALYALFRYDRTFIILIILWQVIIVFSCIGILLLKNVARKILVFMCGLKIVIFVLSGLAMTFIYDVPELDSSVIFTIIYHFYWILPSVYIYIFTRPNIKILFK